jgi:hypothetical protein
MKTYSEKLTEKRKQWVKENRYYIADFNLYGFNLYGFNSPPLCGVILGVWGICSPTSKYAKIEE